MSKKSCPLEQDVLERMKRGQSSHELEQHIKHCPMCRDALLVSRWLNDFKAASLPYGAARKELPDAEFIWEQARASRRVDKALLRKALRPLLIPQVLSYIAAIIGIVFLLSGHLTDIKDFLGRHETLIILKSLNAIIKPLLKALHVLLLPFALVLSSLGLYFLYSILKPRKA